MKIHLLILLVALITNNALFAQDMNFKNDDYAKEWKDIQNLLDKGLPKSANEKIGALYERAKKDNNPSQLVKTLIFKGKYIAELEEDGFVKAINLLRDEEAKATFPAKPILQSLLGQLYAGYLDNNQWRFKNRTTTKDFKQDDIRTWDINKLNTEADAFFKLSLTDSRAQKVAIKQFDAITTEGVNTDNLRPTLYDFLAFRAVDYFTDERTYLTQPAYAFELDNENVLSDAATFLKITFDSKDSTSGKLWAIKTLQQIMAFHQNDKDPAAFVDADLVRLSFCYENAVFADKKETYRKALTTLRDKYNNDPAFVEVTRKLAELYIEDAESYKPNPANLNKDAAKTALNMCREAVQKFPKAYGANSCRGIISRIQEPYVDITTEDVVLPNKPILTLVKFKNADSIYLKVIKINDKILKREFKNDEERLAYFNSLKPLRSWSVKLPNEKDYNTHTTETKIEKLTTGTYLVLAADNPAFSLKNAGKVGRLVTTVSNLAFMQRKGERTANEFVVVDRSSGVPIKGVLAEFFNEQYNSRLRRNETIRLGSAMSDSRGFVKVPFKDNKYFTVTFIYGKDTLKSGDGYNNYLYDEKPTPSINTFFFMDRGIYRPGQTIYFKAIVLQNNGVNKYTIIPNREITVTLMDVNHQKVTDLKLKTNEFGTCNGAFTAPSTGLTGQMHLSTEGGVQYFSVEEYKRPKFEVLISPLDGFYTLNQNIKAQGKAKAFAGSSIDGATVKYRVERIVRFPYWRSWFWNPYETGSSQEIAHGETTTDAQGNFTIPFVAIPNKSIPAKDKPVFDYAITAEVTDITGETHSTTTTVSIGYVAMVLDIAVPEEMNRRKVVPFKLIANNLNGQPLGTKVDVKIELLSSPRRTYISRYWDVPDTLMMEKTDFQRDFPLYPYQNEDKVAFWSVKKKVYDAKFQTIAPVGKDGNVLTIAQMTNWDPGAYRITIAAVDASGERLEVVKHFTLYDLNDILNPINNTLYVVQEGTIFEPGDKVDFGMGTSEESLSVLFEIERRGEIESQEWLNLKGFQNKMFKVNEGDRGNIFYTFTYIKNNRFKTVDKTVVVPYSNKELQFEYQTFRDKLQPGQQEEWRIKISGKNKEKVAAEMVAAMYDASLDQFARNDWNLLLYNTNYPQRRWGSAHFGSEQSVLFYIYQVGNFAPEDEARQYRDLNTFGWFFGGRPVLMRSDAIVYNAIETKAMPAPAASNIKEESVLREVASEGFLKNKTETKSVDKYVPPIVGEDKKEEQPSNLDNVKVRTNLNETVFFFPTLMTDADGSVVLKFKMNEALTRWKFLALAHTTDLKVGSTQREVVTQKDLMVFPNAPRFLRESDKLEFAAKVSNISSRQLRGSAKLMLFDALTMQPVDAILGNAKPELAFEVKAGESTPLSWNLAIPVGKVQAVTYRIVAQAESFSDGEENTLPVLTNRTLVTESLPLSIRGGETKKFEFKSLKELTSNTLQHQSLKLEFTQNPAWYAVQALPYLMEYPYECTEQIFSRYYANALASSVANNHPKIKQVFERWKNTDANALFSNLSKNQELKSALLAETPWVLDAQSEEVRKKNVGLLFDLNRMSNEQTASLNKMVERQLDNGGFAWFPGGRDDWFITQHIVEGLGHLEKLSVTGWRQEAKVTDMVDNAVKYCDDRMIEYYNQLEKWAKEGRLKMEEDHLSLLAIHYLYARSFYNRDIPEKARVFDYFLKQAEKFWTKRGIYEQGLLALALKRYGKRSATEDILKSLKERALNNPELGMYWKTEGGYFWYQAPVETHAVMIELFDEMKETKAVDDLKVWLLKNKQTNDWKTTKATAAAIYALLKTGGNWLLDDKDVAISLDNKPLDISMIKKEAGTGYFKTEFPKETITAKMGDITVSNPNKTVVWGAMYWQYFEQLDKVKMFKETPLKMNKQLFKVVNGDKGEVMSPVTDKTALKPGDKIKVRLEIRVDRDMEYVHIKDMRASGFEPVNVLSQYKWQGGLGYYESTLDATTNFFIDYLAKGTYVFEYPLTVSLKGDFSNGITTIQCMYAPEFTSHSEGLRVSVK